MNIYSTEEIAKKYIGFLESENGRIQQRFLTKAVVEALPANRSARILDAACGPGWLTHAISEKYPHVEGCDSAPQFIAFAQKYYPKTAFTLADLQQPLLYEKNSFDVVVCNMAAHDVINQDMVLQNLATVLRPGGEIIITIPNPYYSYPIVVWKRGIIGRLLRQMPKMRFTRGKIDPKALHKTWGHRGTTYYYSLPDYMQNAASAGLLLDNLKEIRSDTDSPTFNLQYQLFRYPLLLLLKFKKSA